MANIKVSEMAQADNVNDMDLLMIVQNGTNKKTTKQTLLTDITTRLTEAEEDIDNIEIDIDTAKEDIEQNQTNIEQLQQENQNLYNALATVSGTGTNITLNKTSKNKFKKFEVGGNTEQIQLSGKNLFDGSKYAGQTRTHDGVTITVNENGSISMVGTSVSTYSGALTITLDSMPELNGQNLVLSSTSSNSKISIYLQNPSGYSRSVTYNSEEDLKILIQSNTSQTTFNDTFNLQIEQGSTATSYEPYCGGIASPNPEFPQQIKNVTGNVNVKIQNKNLAWNGWAEDFVTRINNSSLASITTKDGKNCLLFDRRAGYGDYDNKYMFKIPFKANTQYTFSFQFYKQGQDLDLACVYTDGTSNAILDNTINTWKKVIFTSAQNKTIKYIRAEYYSGEVYIDLDTFMVEENITATDYVPHQEQNLPFTLAEGQKLMLGGSLQDDGIHNVRGQIVLNGTEDWTDFSYTPGDDNFRVQMVNAVPNILTPPTNPADIICNYFTAVNRDTAYRKEIVGIAQYGAANGRLFICAPISILSTQDMAGWKTWLSTHNLLVEYKLAEEVITPYTEAQQEQYNAIKEAMSYYNQTTISGTSTGVSPIIDAEAIADMNSLLSGVIS